MKQHPWSIKRFTNHIRVQAARKHISLAGNETDSNNLPEDDQSIMFSWACLDENLNLSIQWGKYSDDVYCHQIAIAILQDDTEVDVINNLWNVYDVWSQDMN